MVSIRRYAQADRESLRELVLQLHETMRPMDSDLAPGNQIIERHFNELISRVTQTSGAIFVADDDGCLIGYACVFGSVTPDEVDERPEPYSFIAELFVRSEYRGLELGRRLIERAEHHAAARGSYKLELKVLAQNESAIKFYEALGYAPRVIVMRKWDETVAGEPKEQC
jgi:GNAT superfamily N-acetyltransferase